jgi:ATP-dependent exoDNAse (exonuclease V) beta subunit
MVMVGSLLRIPFVSLQRLDGDSYPSLGEMSVLRTADDADRLQQTEALQTTESTDERDAEIALGIVGHRLIEGLSRARREHLEFEFAEKPVRRALIAEGCPESRLDEMCDVLHDCVSRMRASAHFAFIHSGEHRDAADEMPLVASSEMNTASSVRSAQHAAEQYRVDRTFVASDGVRWVVDYKFSESVDPESHRPQIARYVELFKVLEPSREVKAALYFPRQDAFVVL